MRSKTEIQKETEPFIQIFNSFVEALHPLLILQDPSDQEPLSFLSGIIDALQINLKSIDQRNSEELKNLDEILSSLIKDIQVEILWRIEDQIRNQSAVTNLQEKLKESKPPLAIHEFSSLVEEFKVYLNQNEKWLRDAKLIIKDGQQCIELLRELPKDFYDSISDIIDKIDDQIKRFEQVNPKDNSKLKDAHTELSLLIRTAQSEMLMYFLKQAEEHKALEYIEKLKKYQVMFSEEPLCRLAPQTMSSLIKDFKTITHYATQVKTTAESDNSPVSSAQVSVAKTVGKRKIKKTRVIFDNSDGNSSDRTEKVIFYAEPTKPTSRPFQEQVAKVDAAIADQIHKLQKLDTLNKRREESRNRYNDPVIQDLQDKIKKIQEKIALLNKERSPYKLYLKILLSDTLSESERKEIHEATESFASQIGDTVKSIIPSQQGTVSNLTQYFGIAKSLNDVKREFSKSHHGATLEVLIAKEKEYLQQLTKFSNEAEQENDRISQRIYEIEHPEIFSSDEMTLARVEKKYKKLVNIAETEKKYKELVELKDKIAKAEGKYLALLDQENKITKNLEEKSKELAKQQDAVSKAEEEYKASYEQKDAENKSEPQYDEKLATEKYNELFFQRQALDQVKKEYQVLCEQKNTITQAIRECKALCEQKDAITKAVEESKALYEQEEPLNQGEKEYIALCEQKAALAEAKEEYKTLRKKFDESSKTTKELPSKPIETELAELSKTLDRLRTEQTEAVANVEASIRELSGKPMLHIDALKTQTTIFLSEITFLKDRSRRFKASIEQYNKTVDSVLKEREQFNQDCNDALESVKELFEKTKAQAEVYNLSDSFLADIGSQIRKAESGIRLVLFNYNSHPHYIWNSKKQDQLNLLAIIQSRLQEKIKKGNETFRESASEIKKDVASLKKKINENTHLLKYLYTPKDLADKVAQVEEVCDKIDLILKQVIKPQLKDLSKPIPLNLEVLEVIKQRLAEQNIAIDRAIENAKDRKRAAAAKNRAAAQAEASQPVPKEPTLLAGLAQKVVSGFTRDNEKVPRKRPFIYSRGDESAKIIEANKEHILRGTGEPKKQVKAKKAPSKHKIGVKPMTPSIAPQEAEAAPEVSKEKNKTVWGPNPVPGFDLVPEPVAVFDESLETEIASDGNVSETPPSKATEPELSENGKQIVREMIRKIIEQIQVIREQYPEDYRIPILDKMRSHLETNLNDESQDLVNDPDKFIASLINLISSAVRAEESNYHRLSTDKAADLDKFINWLLRPLTWMAKAWNKETYRARFFPDPSETAVASAAEEAHRSLRQLQQKRADAASNGSENEFQNSNATDGMNP
jgi:hypothetical protein